MTGQLKPTSRHDIQALNRRVKSYIQDSRQQTTWRGYANCWQRFVNFCSPADAWNAKPEDVARYCASMADLSRSPETIRSNLAAITFYFEVLGKGACTRQDGSCNTAKPGQERNRTACAPRHPARPKSVAAPQVGADARFTREDDRRHARHANRHARSGHARLVRPVRGVSARSLGSMSQARAMDLAGLN